MAKKQFKAESKRLMDLMINSIYTHKEIFLREIISNASDAMDKLAYKALTDDQVAIKRKNFKIVITPDKAARTLTISDNGIGMTYDELEANLGTIAKSGSFQFKQDLNDEKAASKVDVIGQFGVGFYSAFMVADRVEVFTRAYGSEEAFKWESSGADGYTISPCEKSEVGTDIVMHIRENTGDDSYDSYLDPSHLQELIKKYSDYIHHPIRMEITDYRMKEKPADAGDDWKPEWEQVTEWQTVNSMIPLWQRQKSKVKAEDYNTFYKEKFADWQDPLSVIHTGGEGMVEYKALLYIPGQTPFDFYTREYEKGLQLYSSGVMIMDKCADLLPDHFRFVKGVVDSPDFSLNISREMLQHTRQLKVIAANLEKKIKAELLRLQKDDREKYEQFWAAFGLQIKAGTVAEYGRNKELLRDLLMFTCSAQDKPTTLAEYKDRMSEDQPFIYYACGETAQRIAAQPQVERILDKGYEILYLTQDVDEFVMKALEEHGGKPFKSVSDEDALPQTEDEKKAADEKAEAGKALTDFVKETLGDKVKDVRISRILKSGAVCMTADGQMSLEMEKYLRRMEGREDIRAERVLELNPDAEAVAALRRAVDSGNKELAADYAQLLYSQALLLADLPVEEPAQFAALVCKLMK